MTVELTMEPGSRPRTVAPARCSHVIEGEAEWAIDEQPAKVLKAGETFYEPTAPHWVSKNPSAKGKTWPGGRPAPRCQDRRLSEEVTRRARVAHGCSASP